jgi:hypothetical protein
MIISIDRRQFEKITKTIDVALRKPGVEYMLTVISMLGLVVMIGALIGLFEIGVLFTAQPIAIALQLMAIALMVWARITYWTSKLSCRCESHRGRIGYYRPLPIHTPSNLHRSMSLWLGTNRFPLVFAKCHAGNTVATGCANANDMGGASGEAEVPGICRIYESHETDGSVPVLIFVVSTL